MDNQHPLLQVGNRLGNLHAMRNKQPVVHKHF